MKKIIDDIELEKCIEWSVTRSSGAGGQHVNKTNSAVIAKLDVECLNLNDIQRNLIYQNLAHRIIQDHFITVRCEDQRDQKSNKDIALKILSQMIEKALFVPKKRIKTKPSKSAIKKRLDGKSKKSVIKKLRQEKF